MIRLLMVECEIEFSSTVCFVQGNIQSFCIHLHLYLIYMQLLYKYRVWMSSLRIAFKNETFVAIKYYNKRVTINQLTKLY